MAECTGCKTVVARVEGAMPRGGRRRMGQHEIEKAIRDLANRVYRVENEVSDIGDGLHTILLGLDEPVAVQHDDSWASAPKRNCRRRRRGDAEERQILRSLAKIGVARVDFSPLPTGHTKVRIDGGTEMSLSPVLVNLLRVLCVDSGNSSDGLVGFKTPSEVARLLSKRTDKEVNQHAVREAVLRLRKALIANGYNPCLLQNDRQRGYRFALRRSDADLIAADRV